MFTNQPQWFEFGMLAKVAIENKITTYRNNMIKYRRHYKQDLTTPIYINTYVLLPTMWLWPNLEFGTLGDYRQPWAKTQMMLRQEFSEYRLTFSKGPETEFSIPGIEKLFKECNWKFWCKIDSTRKTELGRTVLLNKNMTTEDMEARVIGTLMGQAVGDALGTRYEFSSGAAAQKAVTRDKVNGHLPMLGGGPFRLIPGQITDDTELALMIARRLSGIGAAAQFYIAKAFVDWYLSDPFDIGNATSVAFGGINPNLPVEQIHAKMMKNAKGNMESLSNGCLMKISPIALFGSLSADVDSKIMNFAAETCKLSNPNPIAVDAVRVYVYAIRRAIHGVGRQEIWEQTLCQAETELVKKILNAAALQATPAPAENREPIPVDGSSQGYLGIALQLAFYELLHGQSFEESLTRTVARGGDTDTNGCIVGALLGAYYSYSSIPANWSKTVLNVQNPRREQLPELATSDIPSLALRLARGSN
uniref:ADP-ribosylglycohydrolase n=1 Tax=Marseillevirus LCMAC202 TaxID=2506606 RepID=A0A481YXX2_9VIRU|nr:MAG: ADP-ribosylglycohydrolase [Marseillevirus LCMAC202]